MPQIQYSTAAHPWVYESFCSLGFSLPGITADLKKSKRAPHGMIMTRYFPDLGNMSTHTQSSSGIRLIGLNGRVGSPKGGIIFYREGGRLFITRNVRRNLLYLLLLLSMTVKQLTQPLTHVLIGLLS